MNPLKKLEPRQLLFDVLIALVVMAISLAGSYEVTGETFIRDANWIHTLLVVVMTLPLALRRVYPTTVFAISVGAWAIDRGLDYPSGFEAIAIFVAFYTIGAEVDRRKSLLVGGGSAAFVMLWTTLGAITLESVGVVAIATTGISTLTPFLVGREMRTRRRRAEELRLEVDRAEKRREEAARLAVDQERHRIARELHDVVAHQMTVMTIQAEGARRIASESDPKVIDALDTIVAAGRSALADMRKVVGLLREGNGDDPELAPLPGLDDLPALVSNVEAAGVPVGLETRGDPQELPEALELSAFRIVQESLTNTVRHGGPGTSASVRLTFGDDSLDIEVSDNGRGAAAAPSNGGGHGLVGMRERVAVLGGTIDAAPRQGGGFRVRASLPYQS